MSEKKDPVRVSKLSINNCAHFILREWRNKNVDNCFIADKIADKIMSELIIFQAYQSKCDEVERLNRDKRNLQSQLIPDDCQICKAKIDDNNICSNCGEDFTPLDAPTYEWMEKAYRHWFEAFINSQKQNQSLKNELAEMIEVLEFYASKDNWGITESYDGLIDTGLIAPDDQEIVEGQSFEVGGKRARQILGRGEY